MTAPKRMVAFIAALTTAAAALTSCSGSSSSGSSDSIDVLSWWTSASESSALETLVNEYQERNPDISVDEVAVVGGGGSQAHVTLAQRLARGDAPDIWQSLVSGNITAWHDAGVVGDVSTLFTDQVTAQLPQEILNSVSVNGNQYAAPLSVHRANILMFNRDVLSQAGIDQPGRGYSVQDLLDDMDTLEAQGTTPLCIGGADSITTAGLFESVLLSVVGVEGWRNIEADRFDWSSEQVTEALEIFGRLIDHTNAADADRTWDQAAGRLASGECGFYQMNDGALTESEALAGAATGDSSVSAVVFPGTDGAFLMVADAFVRSDSSPHEEATNAFLATVLDPEVQTAVCEVKGCIPTRNDADVSTLTPYQQQAASDLRSQEVLGAISYGEVISPAMQDGFFQAVRNYMSTRDASSFARVLIERVGESQAGPNV